MKLRCKPDKEAARKIINLYTELHNLQNILKNAEEEMNRDSLSIKNTTNKLREILINEKIIDK